MEKYQASGVEAYLGRHLTLLYYNYSSNNVGAVATMVEKENRQNTAVYMQAIPLHIFSVVIKPNSIKYNIYY